MLKLKYIIAALLCLLFLITSCADENMGRVTLHIQRNDLAAKFEKEHPVLALVDKTLKLFTKEAFAGGTWTSIVSPLTLTIESADYETLTYSIPSGATTYSTLVPAGDNVTVTVFSTYFDTVDSLLYKNWGGHETLDISGGEETNLTINMIPTTAIRSISQGTIGELTVSFYTISAIAYPQGTGINIYRSQNSNGPFTKVTTLPIGSSSPFSNSSLTSGNTYYYKISVSGDKGEGIFSNIDSGVAPF